MFNRLIPYLTDVDSSLHYILSLRFLFHGSRAPKEPPNTSFEIQMKLFLSVGGRACARDPTSCNRVTSYLSLGLPG